LRLIGSDGLGNEDPVNKKYLLPRRIGRRGDGKKGRTASNSGE